MKKTLISLIFCCALITGFAQEATPFDDPEIRTNQYGVVVDRHPLTVEQRNGILVFESKKQDYRLWFDIRLQGDGLLSLGNPYNDVGNALALRRSRFAVKAILYRDWYAEMDLSYANSIFELKDAYIGYIGFKDWFFKLGNFKEGFSMDELTSSRYLTFMERSLVAETFAPSRHLGLQAEYNKNWFMTMFGVHFQNIGDSEVRTFSLANNKDYGRSEGYSLDARFVGMPFYKNVNSGMHIGAAISYRTPKTDVDPLKYGSTRYSARSLTYLNRRKYLDTDDILNVKNEVLTGFELAGFYNGFKFQSEYMNNRANLKDGKGNYNFNGLYAQASMLLFGGKQRYDDGQGEFTQPSRGKKWGDLELAVRYDFIDLNDKDVYGGSANGFTTGLTYYVNNNVKFQINYSYVNHDRYANGKGKLYVGHDASGKLTPDYTKIVEEKGKGGDDFGFLGVRFEIDF